MSGRRIVSLVPSLTELLFDLGLEDEVVGITKFCIRPAHWFQTKRRVGGTKNVHPEIVHGLHPDLIIANKEENVREQVEALEAFAQVYVSDVSSLGGALEMIREIGGLTGRSARAAALVAEIAAGFEGLAAEAGAPPAPLPCAYFIWRDPWMVAGGDTFINDMLERAGFINVFRNLTRYPVIDAEMLAASECRDVLLSSEPYPFREQHFTEFSSVLPKARLHLVDGEMFSWYGSRLKHVPLYFNDLRSKLR